MGCGRGMVFFGEGIWGTGTESTGEGVLGVCVRVVGEERSAGDGECCWMVSMRRRACALSDTAQLRAE